MDKVRVKHPTDPDANLSVGEADDTGGLLVRHEDLHHALAHGFVVAHAPQPAADVPSGETESEQSGEGGDAEDTTTEGGRPRNRRKTLPAT